MQRCQVLFYVTFDRKQIPGREHYAIVEAPCEATAIQKVVSAGGKNWTTLYTSPAPIRRANLKLWRKL